MGTPKHLLHQDGCTWIERTLAILRPRVAEIVIAGAGLLPPTLAGERRVDDIPGIGGPLAGILAAFRVYPQVSWLVTACDMPDTDDAALQWLLAWRGADVRAVMPDLAADGHIEPLLAYYDHSCRPLLETMAAQGHQRMNRLREAEGVLSPQPPASLRAAWRNVNTPRELARISIPEIVAPRSDDNSNATRATR